MVEAMDDPVGVADPMSPPILPLPEEGLGSLEYWQGEISASDDQIKTLLQEWRTNLNRYQNKPLKTTPSEDTIWVPKDYALTERKKPLLWFQLPDVACTPNPGHAPVNTIAPIFAAVLNHYLRHPHEFHANVVMTEVVFDAICPAGLMVCKLGYDAYTDGTLPMQVPQIGPDGQPAIDPLTGQPILIEQEVPNILAERYYSTRFSPAYLRLPCEWVGSDYDRAPWIAHRFEDDKQTLIQRYGIDPDEAFVEDDRPLESLNAIEDETSQRQTRRLVRGTEIWYRTSLFDPTVKHPDRQRQLVLIGDRVVVHRDSPHQTVEPTGRLSADSLIGYPIHVGSLRTVADGKFPNSDVQQTRPQVDELGKFRTTMVRQRSRSVPQRVGDKNRLPPDVQEKFAQGVQQEIILVDGAPGDIIMEVARANYPRENFTANDYVDKDLNECWAMGSNQLGLDEGGQTATEASLRQRNTDSRLAVEQARVKDYFIRLVQKAAVLVQRYCSPEDIARIVGPQAAQMYQQWQRTSVTNDVLWTIKPDSQLRTDLAQERQYRTQAYNQFRRDPLINPQALLTWALEPFGLNPQQFLAHAGPMPGVNPVNKRQLDQTGALPGPSGEPNTGDI